MHPSPGERRIVDRLPIVTADNTIVRIADDVAWTSSDIRIVALDLARPGSSPVVLEATAALVWDEIAAGDGLTSGALLARLAESFETDAEVIRPDLEQLIDDLADRNLLVG